MIQFEVTSQEFVDMCNEYWFRKREMIYGPADSQGEYTRPAKELPGHFRLFNGPVAQICERCDINVSHIVAREYGLPFVVQGTNGKLYHFGGAAKVLEYKFDWVFFKEQITLSGIIELAVHESKKWEERKLEVLIYQ